MIAGRDFPSAFEKDNFVERRSIGNRYDPESLITQAEIDAGFTYKNSRRNWANEKHYQSATDGYMTIDEILRTAPRVFVTEPMTGSWATKLPYSRANERTR